MTTTATATPASPATTRSPSATRRRNSPSKACSTDACPHPRRRRSRAGDRLGVPTDRPRRAAGRRSRRRQHRRHRSGDPGARGRAGGRRRRRVRPSRHPVFRADRRTGTARGVEGLCPPVGRRSRDSRTGIRPLRPGAVDVGGRRRSRLVGRPRRARWSSSSTDSPPARVSSVPDSPGETDAAIVDAAVAGAFVLEERMTGSRVLAAGTVRRHPGRRAPARPGPQAHRRGRHRPEHRRHGRLRTCSGSARPDPNCSRRSCSPSSTTSLPQAPRTSA